MKNKLFIGATAAALALLVASCPANVFYGLEPSPLDTDGPEIDVINPEEGQVVSGVLIVIGTSSDKYSVQSMHVNVDGGTWIRLSGTFTWNWTLDTTTLAKGSHVIGIKAIDQFGNESSTSRTITVDQSVPSIAWAYDEGNFGNYLRGSAVSVSGTAVDDNGVRQVQISFNGGLSWVSASVGTSTLDQNGTPGDSSDDTWIYPWSYTIANTASIKPGDGSLVPVFRVIDDSGLIGTASYLAYVDNTAPLIEISSPLDDVNIDGDLIGFSLSVNGSSSDALQPNPASIRDITVLITDVSSATTLATATLSDMTTTWSTSFDITSYASTGAVTISATIRDKAGNETTDEIGVSLDATPPLVGATISRDNAPATLDGDLSKQANNFKEGAYVISGTVTDPDGSLATEIASISFTIVNESGSTVHQGLVDNPHDGLLEDGKTDASGAWSLTMDLGAAPLSAVADGEYELGLRVTDTAGGFDVSTRAFNIDRVAPSVSFDSPVEGAKVSGTAVPVEGNASDATSSVYSIRIYADNEGGGEPYETDGTATAPAFTLLNFAYSPVSGAFTFDWNTTAFNDSPIDTANHPITIVVTDLAGNVASQTHHVEKDADVPSAAMLTYSHPTNADYVDQPLTTGRYIHGDGIIAGSASDNSQVTAIRVKVDGGAYENVTSTAPALGPGVTSATWSFDLSAYATNLTPGAHAITVEVSDGVKTNTTSKSIIVDETNPSVSNLAAALQDASGTSFLHGLVDVSGTSADTGAGVESLVLTVDESPDADEDPEALSFAGLKSFSAVWDTEALPTLAASPVIAKDGIRIEAVATDGAGNLASAQLSVNVRPYVASVSVASAKLGDTVTVTGDNFFSGAFTSASVSGFVSIGDATLIRANVSGTSNNAVTPNSISVTIPTGLPTANGLSSGAVLVNTNGVTNAAQAAVKLDLFDIQTLVATVGGYPSLSFDGTSAWVSYQSKTGPNNYMNIRDGSNTRTSPASGNPGAAWTSTVYVDATHQYVAYSGLGATGVFLRLASDRFATWTGSTQVTLTTGGGSYVDLAVDPSGNAHAVYFNGATIEYKRYSPDLLTLQSTVDLDGGGTAHSVAWSRIGLDGSNPHVVWYDLTDQNLKYVYYNGSAWSSVATLDSGLSSGQYGADIAVADDHSIHVAYSYGADADLRYLRSAGPGQPWDAYVVVDQDEQVGYLPSITTDSNNHPHIVSANTTNGRARYARNIGLGWETMYTGDTAAIPNVATAANTTSIARSGDGTIHMLYPLTGVGLRDAIYLPED